MFFLATPLEGVRVLWMIYQESRDPLVTLLVGTRYSACEQFLVLRIDHGSVCRGSIGTSAHVDIATLDIKWRHLQKTPQL